MPTPSFKKARVLLVAALLVGCHAAPATPEPLPADAGSEPPPPSLTGACSRSGAPPWLTALRAPPEPGRSRLLARGKTWAELRESLDPSLLPAASPPVTRPAEGDTAAYVGATAQVLRTAAAAFAKSDAVLARRAAGELEGLALSPSYFGQVVVDDATIRVGGGLTSLAEALDLLSAVLTDDELAAARRSFASSALAFHGFVSDTVVRTFLMLNRSNHCMKVGAGLVSPALVLAESDYPTAPLADGLALMTYTVHGGESDPGAGWAEGPGYFAFALEAAGPVLLAVDAAWPTFEGPGCVACPGEPGFCGDRTTLEFPRPSQDLVLKDAVRWSASLVTSGGWFFPIDDARIAAPEPVLYDLLLGERVFGRLPPSPPLYSPTGVSNDLSPFASLNAAAAKRLADGAASPALWPAAGTAVLHEQTGLALDALLVGESGRAREGGQGHEHPDALALSLAADGVLVLGGSGYSKYSERAAVARPDANTLITIDGTLPLSAGQHTLGPEAVVSATAGGAQATSSFDDVTLTRDVSLQGGALHVTDTVELGKAHDVAWHFHGRGTASADGKSWTVGALTASLALPPSLGSCTAATAPGCDVGQTLVPHPVLRCSLALPAGRHTVTWSLAVAKK